MTHCSLAKQCAFFAIRDEGTEIREYLTGLYCAGNFSDCARYRAALKLNMGKLVPDDIFPNEDDFVSLFAWSVNRGERLVSKCGRTRHPGRLPVSAPEKIGAPCGHLPATRQIRSQR